MEKEIKEISDLCPKAVILAEKYDVHDVSGLYASYSNVRENYNVVSEKDLKILWKKEYINAAIVLEQMLYMYSRDKNEDESNLRLPSVHHGNPNAVKTINLKYYSSEKERKQAIAETREMLGYCYKQIKSIEGKVS